MQKTVKKDVGLFNFMPDSKDLQLLIEQSWSLQTAKIRAAEGSPHGVDRSCAYFFPSEAYISAAGLSDSGPLFCTPKKHGSENDLPTSVTPTPPKDSEPGAAPPGTDMICSRIPPRRRRARMLSRRRVQAWSR
mmetsp:Transcript_90297/g.233074  ORF Transcript_90297/g.233074 Transcript_90297/m.233074 type:complete len:133 (+) Transcript_90297:526-924(+)